MKKLFGKKSTESVESKVEESKVDESKVDESKVEKVKVKETSLVDPDYNRKKLFKKGINRMADEKLDEACELFEQALRIDPNSVETLMKLGYARFHLDDHSEALNTT